MMGWRLSFLAFACLSLSGAGCGDECAPTDFGGGQACAEDGRFILSCQFIDCFEPPCGADWVISETPCPPFLPRCMEVAPGDVTCVGEIIGTCSSPGVESCEDVFTQITCADDGTGALRLMRGPCGPGVQCVSPAPGSAGGGAVGCQPSL